MKNFLQGLRMVIKYGAYITVIINVIGYAIEQFEKVETKETEKIEE